MPAAYCGRVDARNARAAVDDAFALHEVGEEGAEAGTEVLAIGGELDGGAQVVEIVAGVYRPFRERERRTLVSREEQADGIRELQLATLARP